MKPLVYVVTLFLASLTWGQMPFNCATANAPKQNITIPNWSLQVPGDLIFGWATSYATPSMTATVNDTGAGGSQNYVEVYSPANVEGNGIALIVSNATGPQPGSIDIDWSSPNAITLSAGVCEISGVSSLVASANSLQDEAPKGSDLHGQETLQTGTLNLPAGNYLVIACWEGGATQLMNPQLETGWTLMLPMQHSFCGYELVSGPATVSTSATWTDIARHASSWIGALE